MLIHVVSEDVTLNGYSIIQTDDIKSFRIMDADQEEFHRRALNLRGMEPRLPSGLSLEALESMEAVLDLIGGVSPLASIFIEKFDPEVCFIGQVTAVSDGEVALLEIDPAAEWDEEPEIYKINDITRIDFGGLYEDALWSVAKYRETGGGE